MATSRDQKNQNQTDPLPSEEHEHILHGIDPETEAALARKSRQWYKNTYGGDDAVLDRVFGLRSRGNAAK